MAPNHPLDCGENRETVRIASVVGDDDGGGDNVDEESDETASEAMLLQLQT